jgi:hypothetical protein
MPNQARFLSFMDMIDGGGAGAYGDKFEGGGVFSALANMMATPYGSEDEERRRRSIEGLRAAGLLGMETPKEATVIRTGDKRPKPTKPSPQQLAEARMAELERQRGLEQDVFDPRGPNQMGASGFRNPTEGYPNMSMPAIAGYTVPRAADVPAGVSNYPDMSMPAIAGYTTPAPVSAMAMAPTGMPAPAGSGVTPRQPMPESMPMERYMVAPSMIDVQPPRGMNLPQDATMSRAMQALRQRFPNATPEQLANAAAMMGM